MQQAYPFLHGVGLWHRRKQEDNGRQLMLAVCFSLLLHSLLFVSWQYGWPSGALDGFRPGEENTHNEQRLEVRLLQQDDTEKSGASEHSSAEASLTRATVASEVAKQTAATELQTTQTPLGIPLDALYYHSLPELDQRPLLKRIPKIDEAPGGMQLAVNGTALIELLIENTGRINAVKMVRTDLPATYVSALQTAFAEIEYTPGIKQEHPVRSRLYIEVSYVDGVVNNIPLPVANLGRFPSAPAPHTPITLPPDRHKRKFNPP